MTSWTTESSVRWSGRGRRMLEKIDFQLCEDWSLIIIHNFLINLLWSTHLHNYYHQTVFLKAYSLCNIYFDNCKFRSWVCYISNKNVLFDKQKYFYAKSRNFVRLKFNKPFHSTTVRNTIKTSLQRTVNIWYYIFMAFISFIIVNETHWEYIIPSTQYSLYCMVVWRYLNISVISYCDSCLSLNVYYSL